MKQKNKSVWMSHQDAVTRLPKGSKIIASTKESKLTIIENTKKKIYGVQFHLKSPTQIMELLFLKFYIFNLSNTKKWKVHTEKIRLINEIKSVVKKDKVICALSGGVDSSVVALLINKA